MAKIRIEDLPDDVQLSPEELDKLTPEELEKILGAGRRSLRPEMEALEGRLMMDAGLGQGLPNLGGGGDPAQLVQVRTLAKPAQGSGPAIDYGGMVETPGTTNLKLANGYTGTLRTFQFDGTLRHEVTIFDSQGKQVFYGLEDANGRYNVEITPPGSATKVKATFDRYGGAWNDSLKTWVPDLNQKMVSRDGQPVSGEMRDNKWVETITTGTTRQVATYERLGINLTGDSKLQTDEYVDGKLQKTTKYGSTGNVAETVAYEYVNGKLKKTTKADGGGNVDTVVTYDGADFSRRTERFSKGVLQERVDEKPDGSAVRGRLVLLEKNYYQQNERYSWVETEGTVDKNGAFVEKIGGAVTTRLDFARGNYTGIERTFQVNGTTRHEVTIFDRNGKQVFHGLEDANGRYNVEFTRPGSQKTLKLTFDRYAGWWSEDDNTFVPRYDQKLVARDGQPVNPEFQADGKYVETTTAGTTRQVTTYKDLNALLAGNKEQTDEYVNGELKKTIRYDGGGGVAAIFTYDYVDGKLKKTTEYRGDGTKVGEVVLYDGFAVRGQLQQDGTWKETLGTLDKNGAFVEKTGVGARTSVYEKQDGKLLWRRTIEDGAVRETKALPDGRYTETLTYTDPKSDRVKAIDIIDRVDGDRTLYSRDIYYKDGRIVHGEGKVDYKTNKGPWVVTEYTTTIEAPKDGPLKVNLYTKEGSIKTYELRGGSWKLVTYNRLEGGRWVEESWGADGSYTKNVWSKKDHGAEGSKDHIAKVVGADGKFSITLYHVKAAYKWRLQEGRSDDATITWVYSADKNGNPNYTDLQEYHLKTPDGYYNDFMKSKIGSNESWAGGFYGNGWNVKIDDPNYIRDYMPKPEQLSGADVLAANTRGETLGAPPFAQVQTEQKDGKYIETYRFGDKVIRLTYNGSDKKELLGQTVGQWGTRPADGTRGAYQRVWIETTTHSKDFVSRTEFFEGPGGKFLGREITEVASLASRHSDCQL